ncbi:uncharacterized protein LOC144626469 [Crassostrea virginica]
MEDKVNISPSRRDLEQKSESRGEELNVRTSTEKGDISNLKKGEERESHMADISKTSSVKSKSTGKVSACATPKSRPSSKQSGRSSRLSVKDAELQRTTIVLRTEKELREFLAVMERPCSQSASDTGSSSARSSLPTTKSRSRQSIERIMFADLDNEETRRPKKHQTRLGSRAGSKEGASPVSGDKVKKESDSSQKDTATTHMHDTRGNERSSNDLESRSPMNVSIVASRNNLNDAHSEKTAETKLGNKNSDLAQGDENVQNTDHSRANSKNSLKSSLQSDSRRSRSESQSGQYTTDSCFSDHDDSRSESKCSKYSRDESDASRSNKILDSKRNTPDTESLDSSRNSSDVSSRSVSEGSENGKSSSGSELTVVSRIKSASSKDTGVSRQSVMNADYPESENIVESRQEKAKEVNEIDTDNNSQKKAPLEGTNDNKLRMKSKNFVGSNLNEQTMKKRSPSRNGKHRNKCPVKRSPHIEDKVFWREKNGSNSGTKTVNIQFQIEKKPHQDQHASAFDLQKTLKSIRKTYSHSKKVISNASTKCETVKNDVNDLSVLGLPFQRKEENTRSPKPTEFHYEDDFEDESGSEKAQEFKETLESEKSENDICNIDVDNAIPSNSKSLTSSTKDSATEVFEKRHPESDVPEQKSSELNMVGKGFDFLTIKKKNIKGSKSEKQGTKNSVNKIAREKPCTLQCDTKGISAVIAKKILEDKKEASGKRSEKKISERTSRTVQIDRANPKQDIKETPMQTKEKQQVTEKVRKQTILEGLMATDNMHRNREKYDAEEMVITGTAKSSPYLNQQHCSIPKIPKACATSTVLPSLANTEMNPNRGPYVFSSGQPKQSTMETVLPSINATRLIPQEYRCGDQKRTAHIARSCQRNEADHPLAELGYSQRKPEERILPRRPRLVNERNLPKLSSTASQAHLNAEAKMQNGALEVTIFDPEGHGCRPDSVNIKLTVLHQSRGKSTRAHLATHPPTTPKPNQFQPEETDLIQIKAKKQRVHPKKKTREIKRQFSQH